MRITRSEVLEADGGLRVLSFLKIETDEGLVGWAEFSDSIGARGLGGLIATFMERLLGRDPLATSSIVAALRAEARLSPAGFNWQAIATIENALLDIRARAFDVPVYELLGGAVRESLPVYWSHCGMRRIIPEIARDLLGLPVVGSLEDLTKLGTEVAASGFRACKTNPILFSNGTGRMLNPGFRPGADHGRVHPRSEITAIVEQLRALRAGLGDDIGLALDINFGFTVAGARELASALEGERLMWLEFDSPEPAGLALIRQQSATPIASLEAIYGTHGYRPYFEARAVDVAIVDVMWNGLFESLRVAALAQGFEVNVATHGYTGALAAIMSAHLAMAIANLEIVELEVDDVAWRDEFVTAPLTLTDGRVRLPDGPGWGATVNEEAIRAHPVRAR